MKNITLIILLVVFFMSCSDDSIDFKGIEGFYTYNIIDFKTGHVKDTLFSCLTKSKLEESDTLKIYSSILGLHLGKSDKLFFIWSVKEINGKMIPATFTFLSKSYPAHYTWSVEKELGFSSGTFERKFKILSKDTTLNVFSTRLDNILLLEQRDWLDVGGMWHVQLFGFNKKDKLVYMNKYVESKPWSELAQKSHAKFYPGQSVVHTEKYTYHSIKDYLILSEFIYDDSITEKKRVEWESKNSKVAQNWLDWRDDLSDYIPPPRPSIDISKPDTLLNEIKLELD